MFELQYFLIGIIQGVTEFLPISSSGHLVLFANFTNWEDQGIFTDIAVHVGTLLAVIIYLRKEVLYLLLNIFRFEILHNTIVSKIIVATMPAVIVGFFAYEFVTIYFRDIKVVAISSILFSIVLYFADKISISKKKWENILFKEVLVVGVFQVLAFIPGASRAGVTITAARFLGYDRSSATKFSMLLSIPIISASLLLSFIEVNKSSLNNIYLFQSLFAAFVAFITALISISFMMKLIQNNSFNIFIIYRILLGIFLLYFYE